MNKKEIKIQKALGVLCTYIATVKVHPKSLFIKVEATSEEDARQKVLLKLNSKQRMYMRHKLNRDLMEIRLL